MDTLTYAVDMRPPFVFDVAVVQLLVDVHSPWPGPLDTVTPEHLLVHPIHRGRPIRQAHVDHPSNTCYRPMSDRMDIVAVVVVVMGVVLCGVRKHPAVPSIVGLQRLHHIDSMHHCD